MKAPAQHMADTRPNPVPQILLRPQLAWPPNIMGGCISTTMPNKLHKQPAKPKRPRGSPLRATGKSVHTEAGNGGFVKLPGRLDVDPFMRMEQMGSTAFQGGLAHCAHAPKPTRMRQLCDIAASAECA